MIIIKILSAWFLADFIAGLVHWWQDRFLSSKSRASFLKRISADNELHHENPYAMCRYTPVENLRTSAPYGLALSLITFLAGAPLVIWLALFFVSFGNLVHRYAHDRRNKVPLGVKFLQDIGLFISPRHHNDHHRGIFVKRIPKEQAHRNFCPMTNYLNPILDYVKFFSRLEKVIIFFFPTACSRS